MTPPAADKPLNVFLIEDDLIDAENVRRALQGAEGLSLQVAHDGQEALDMLTSGEVESQRLVILLDLNMPRMNGIEFLQALRDTPFAHLPVIVLTTSDDERDKVAAYRLNVAGYILKPVTNDAFVTTMDKVEAYWRLQEFP